MTKYMIGVDSGGTSTVAAAYDLEGKFLIETKTGFGNLLIDEEVGLRNIKAAVEEIFSELGIAKCQTIVLGVAGVDSGNFKEIILEAISNYGIKCVVLNDAWLAHYALLNGKDGCLIIAGTGSIAIGRAHGKEERVGGWGNLLGDEGSGFDIAKNLIISVLKAYDENRIFSDLEQKLLDHLGFETPFELVKFVYSASKDQVAKISLFVAQEAERNDQQAKQLLKQAGEDLGTQAIMLLEKLSLQENKKIAVTGNVLLKNDIVYQAFQQKVLERFKDCEFIREDIVNTLGGYYYWKNQQLNA